MHAGDISQVGRAVISLFSSREGDYNTMLTIKRTFSEANHPLRAFMLVLPRHHTHTNGVDGFILSVLGDLEACINLYLWSHMQEATGPRFIYNSHYTVLFISPLLSCDSGVVTLTYILLFRSLSESAALPPLQYYHCFMVVGVARGPHCPGPHRLRKVNWDIGQRRW